MWMLTRGSEDLILSLVLTQNFIVKTYIFTLYGVHIVLIINLIIIQTNHEHLQTKRYPGLRKDRFNQTFTTIKLM